MLTTPNPQFTGQQFKKIDFGFADAREEADDPKLLMEGYYELPGLTSEATHGRKFLFLGYKGSGKSAIGQHLSLRASKSTDMFVDVVNLGEFPYKALANLTGPESTARFTTAWTFLLLVRLFSSLYKDEEAWMMSDDLVVRMLETLLSLNLLLTPDLHTLVADSQRTSLSVGIKDIVQLGTEATTKAQTSPIPFLAEKLRAVSVLIQSNCKHILIIDGLDDILTPSSDQLDPIMGLVLTAADLNASFRRNKVPLKIIVLCRTDLFDRLSDSNKNKIKQDSSIELSWFNDPREPKSSQLLQLADRRALLADATCYHVLQFFPDYVSGRPTWQFLLENTRHTPRDFLQLLKYIQEASGEGPIQQNQVLSGSRNYSQNYFLGEIRDEIGGYLSSAEVEDVFRALGTLRHYEFSMKELRAAFVDTSAGQKIAVEHVAELLFNCSALGNVRYNEHDVKYFHFRHRSRAAHLNKSQQLMLHPGLWKAVNLV